MKQNLQFAPIITIVAGVLGLCAYPVQAQRGARALTVSSTSTARTASPQLGASQAANPAGGKNRQSLRPTSSQPNPILVSSSRFPPVRRGHPAPLPRTTGYYWIFDGGAYWIPGDGEQAQDNQTAVDQMGGGQSVDSGQNQPLRVGSGIEQLPGPDAQSSLEDSYASQGGPEKESSSVLDEGEFTLVLSDGKQIEAVAFTHAKNTIVYITTAGSRYTIAANELDSESTLRVNQERGTPLQSPL